MPSATLLHATVWVVDSHVVFVVRCLSWDDAGFLALPLAMKGRAESLAALLSLTPGSFEGRCASNISSTVPRCCDLGQEGNSEI